MAEAEPHDPISLLFLSPKWQYDTYGVASVVRFLVNDLWLTDPDGQKIQMTCAILQEDGEITKDDKEDAAKQNVKLRGVQYPRGTKTLPTIQVLDTQTISYYQHLVLKQEFDFIIGHIPFLANAALNLTDLCKQVDTKPNVILLTHAIPQNSTGDTDVDLLLQWLKDSKMVLSIGENVKADIDQYVSCLQASERPVHQIYIPGCPAELLTILQGKKSSSVTGSQRISVVTKERKDLEVSGLNYSLAVASATMASENIHRFCGIQAKMQFLVLASNQEERDAWETSFKEVKDRELTRDKRLSFEFHVIENTSKLKSLMKMTTVMLLPLKTDSPLFGVEALIAAYSGVPILVSSNSGFASLMNSLGEGEAIVYNTTENFRNDSKVWSERIIQKIRHPDQAQIMAQSLRGTLLLDASIAASHIEFIKIVTDKHAYKLKIDLDTDGTILFKSLTAAKRFGVKCDEKSECNKYIAAYFSKLLLQREKLDLGILDSYIPQDVKEAWREFLSCLEQTKRKLLGVAEGSLNFTLFCPTTESYKQLLQETWRNQFTEKLKHLISEIGISSVQLTITEPKVEAFVFRQSQTLPVFSRLRLNDETESSAYGTESIDSLEQMSLIHPTSRVVDWLKEVDSGEGSSTVLGTEPTEQSEWNLVNTLDSGFCYPEPPRTSALWFSVGESGRIGVSFLKTNPLDSVLYLLYPFNPPSPITLASDIEKIYVYPVFIKQSGREYLAVHDLHDASIHLFDTENHTSQIVYRAESRMSKYMVLCAKDDVTVVLGEQDSKDGVHNVYLLNTSSDKWSLRASLMLQTGFESIDDMCSVQLAYGTACLVLCNSSGPTRGVMAVEMLSGNMQWRLGPEKMGEGLRPYSVCADRDYNIYVCDHGHHRVCVLSPEDGCVITVLNTQQHGIFHPVRIQICNDQLRVAHLSNLEKGKWVISLFKRK